MSAFEDDVEPVEEPLSRGGTPFGGKRGAAGKSASAAGSAQANTRQLSPEPDEDLDTTDGRHSMWLVKVPRFLLEGWSKVDEDDKRLGTVRVYDPDHRGNQRMELLLPEAPAPAIPLPPSHPYLQTNYPRKYDLRLTSEQGSSHVRNLYAFKERLEGADEDDDDPDSGVEDSKGKSRSDDRPSKGRRVVSMVGTIANEAALKPQVVPSLLRTGRAQHGVGLTPEYRDVLRKRRLEASRPRHSVKVLDQSDRAHTNMLSSGVTGHTNAKGKASFIANAQAEGITGRRGQQAASTERFARMPRNELLDILFELFDQFQYWNIKGLRAKVQQPEVYLREVLSSIADLHKRGPYTGNWSLKPEFSEMRKQQDRANNMATSALADTGGSVLGGSTGGGGTGESSGSSSSNQLKTDPNGAGGTAPGAVKVENDQDDDEDDLQMEDVA